MTPDDIAKVQTYLDQPELLLDAIDEALEGASAFDLPLVDLAPDEEDDRPYRSTENGRPQHRIADRLLREHQELFIKIACVKLDYCAKKKRHAATITLLQAICDSLLSANFQCPIPAAIISCYCLQSLFLDRVCRCSD